MGPEAGEAPDLARALALLYERVPLGMRLGLGPMQVACARAGHPERAFPAVHVAGTNGKGSTSAMLEAIARSAGLRTGLYTSPHLLRFAERIRLDGEPITDDALATLLEDALALGPDLSFFEAATLAAFLAFARARVDLAILEVGIGGRLDATNVLPTPRAAAITRIALDHQDRLGDTLEDIAREKAGIAKPGLRIVLGPLAGTVREATLASLAAAGAVAVDAVPSLPPSLALGLAGPHQEDNARIAWTLAAELGLPEPARRRGLEIARWPGRLERIDAPSGPVVLDGAHNPDGAVALVRALATPGLFPTRPAALVYGALADKPWREMLDALAAVDAPRFYAAPDGRAPAPPEELAAHLGGTACASLELALDAARRAAGPSGLVVVCGSLYLVGAARALLLDLPRDRAVAL
jgi:dihydrofolate synthase/folylpolyglutamate synthase